MKKKLENIIEKIKTKRSIHYIIICVIGLLISIPFFWVQIRTTDDGWLHLLRLVGLDNAMDKGAFPFLVFPYLCNDWGYSMTAFYPTIVAYVPYVLGLISGTFANGLKIFATLTTILSGVFMYNFMNEVTKKKGIAFFSAIIYMTLPYKLEDIFNRYAIGEFTAFVFMPLVFQGLYNLLHGDKKRHYYIAIGATGLLLSHTISTEYTAIFCLIYILFNLKAFLKKDVIIKCIINVVFILLMSALFLLPMLEFKMQAQYSIFTPEIIKTSGEYAADNTIQLWQLLKDKGEENGVSFVVGIPFIVMLFSGVLAYRKIDKEQKDFYITSIIFGVISLIMCTSLFPWQIMPDILCTLQYPWRMLGFALMFFTPVCAMNVYYLITLIKKTWLRNTTYIVALAILLAFTAHELSAYTAEDTTVDEQYEQNAFDNPQIHYFSVNRDYMPAKALVQQYKYLKTRGDNTVVFSGQADIENESKDAFHIEMKIKNATQGTELELPFLFYPGYTVVLQYDDLEITLETTESDYGFVKVVLPDDVAEGKITVDYTATTLDKVAYVISPIALLAFIVYVVIYRRKYKLGGN